MPTNCLGKPPLKFGLFSMLFRMMKNFPKKRTYPIANAMPQRQPYRQFLLRRFPIRCIIDQYRPHVSKKPNKIRHTITHSSVLAQSVPISSAQISGRRCVLLSITDRGDSSPNTVVDGDIRLRRKSHFFLTASRFELANLHSSGRFKTHHCMRVS